MAGLSGVGSGTAAATGSAKMAPAASTVDALSMSRLESLLSRMFGPAAYGLDASARLTAFTRREFGENAARHVECRKGYHARHQGAGSLDWAAGCKTAHQRLRTKEGKRPAASARPEGLGERGGVAP